MEKAHGRRWLRAVLYVLLTAAVLLLAGICAVNIAYTHRSDPSGLKRYETGNPFIADGGTMISAHRAGAGIAPEETMKAFSYCAENDSYKVDIYEFDLHITKDGVLVLLHDNILDRVSDCEQVFGASDCKPVDYTYEQLRQLNMGAKFVDESGAMPYSSLSGESVPDDLKILDLDTILDYLESKGRFRYIIEIKNKGKRGKRSLDILYNTLKERKMVDRVILGCFHEEVSQYKDEAYPDLARGAYKKEATRFYVCSLLGIKNYNPAFSVLQLPFNEGGKDQHINTGTVSLINYAHAHDLAVQYWTINDTEDIAYLKSIGADAVMSDYPDRAFNVQPGN